MTDYLDVTGHLPADDRPLRPTQREEITAAGRWRKRPSSAAAGWSSRHG